MAPCSQEGRPPPPSGRAIPHFLVSRGTARYHRCHGHDPSPGRRARRGSRGDGAARAPQQAGGGPPGDPGVHLAACAVAHRGTAADRHRGRRAVASARRVTEFLTLEDALAAGEAALGQPPEVRDYGLLESALGRPPATVFGEEAYPGLDAKAAALLASLVANHTLVDGFVDGNKGLGWVCARLFYILNGRDLKAPEDDAFDLVMSIARGELLDVPVI